MQTTKIKKEIENLSYENLLEIEGLIKKVKADKAASLKKNEINVFDLISQSAADAGMKDWARNHDHYLYGSRKR